MSDTSPTQGPHDDRPILFNLPILRIDDHGVPVGAGDDLVVVTEDGRPLRVTRVRYLGYNRSEITVTEEAD